MLALLVGHGALVTIHGAQVPVPRGLISEELEASLALFVHGRAERVLAFQLVTTHG